MTISPMTTRSTIFRVTIFLGLAALVVIFLLEANRRHGLYWYDVHQDYQYSFNHDNAKRISVEVTRAGVKIPDLEESWDTLLLPISIKATFTGSWFEPTIVVHSRQEKRTHTFERGARGLRYLVLDPNAVRSGEMLRLSARHIRWEEQDSDLLLFSAPEIEDTNLLILAPHPDDAEIAAYGLYSGYRSYIATVSAGNYVDGLYAHLTPDRDYQDSIRGRVRAWDSLVVPTWGGVEPERIVNLGYWNGTLRALHDHRDRETGSTAMPFQDPNRYRGGAIAEMVDNRRAEATWHSLVQDLQAIIAAVRPGVIVAPHPALDAATDHQYTTIALLEALDAAGDNSTVLLLYTNHHVGSEYYPFGPAESAVDLPPLFDDSSQYSGFYSHWLSEQDQMNKLFALEAMHDLRAAPRLLHGGPTQRFKSRINAAFDGLVRDPLGTYNYIRRAVRSNEIFFVVRPEDRLKVEADFAAP
jgi:LmbE family N-acetylglucosaminyl deacetylase